MRELPRPNGRMPAALTLEKPATNLASLALSESLDTLIQTVVAQWIRLDAFAPLKRHGIGPINRALFHGPPGNGKTIAAQVIASRLECPLYRVCSERLISKYLGDTTSDLGGVMDWIAAQGVCVVLWDEVEAIFPSRSRSDDGSSANREVTSAMTVFWQRLDRWTAPTLFLLATNLIDRLDAALRSRIELQLEFGPPTPAQAHDVLSYWSEVLHEYGSESWAPLLRERIEDESLLVSFRALWQAIAAETRQHVLRGTE